ncbi:hypothetical protein QAD02_000804 [Eretmocerus hayati]|uniref:Uncharacterized protein n=1 Tax=Eretmocerus hayati TaxID=131215 RepID=A0ACC2NEF3_9HYME|nr:hypothetical protein QAD02_000804 [Eretmocerus hayati]
MREISNKNTSKEIEEVYHISSEKNAKLEIEASNSSDKDISQRKTNEEENQRVTISEDNATENENEVGRSSSGEKFYKIPRQPVNGKIKLQVMGKLNQAFHPKETEVGEKLSSSSLHESSEQQIGDESMEDLRLPHFNHGSDHDSFVFDEKVNPQDSILTSHSVGGNVDNQSSTDCDIGVHEEIDVHSKSTEKHSADPYISNPSNLDMEPNDAVDSAIHQANNIMREEQQERSLNCNNSNESSKDTNVVETPCSEVSSTDEIASVSAHTFCDTSQSKRVYTKIELPIHNGNYEIAQKEHLRRDSIGRMELNAEEIFSLKYHESPEKGGEFTSDGYLQWQGHMCTSNPEKERENVCTHMEEIPGHRVLQTNRESEVELAPVVKACMLKEHHPVLLIDRILQHF